MGEVDNYGIVRSNSTHDDDYSDVSADPQHSLTTLRDDVIYHVIHVEQSSVVTCFATLLILVTVGVVTNVVIFIATGCRRRLCLPHHINSGPLTSGGEFGRGAAAGISSGILRRSAVRSLCVVSLLVCALLAPLEFATVLSNHVMVTVPSIVCYTAACSFHLCLAAIICLLALLTVLGCDGNGSGAGHDIIANDKSVASNRTNDKTSVTAGGAIYRFFPWLIAISAAVIVGAVNLNSSIEYQVCTRSAIYYSAQPPTEEDLIMRAGNVPVPLSPPSQATVITSVVLVCFYVAILATSTIVVAFAICRMRRNQDAGLRETTIAKKTVNCSESGMESRVGGGGKVVEGGDISAKETDGGSVGKGGKKKQRRTSKTGSVQSSKKRDSSSRAPSRDVSRAASRDVSREASREPSRDVSRDVSQDSLNSATSLSRKAQQIFCFGSPQPCTDVEATAEEDDDDIDDTFDMRMRLKFQKKTRSNSRRHTVANIGLVDMTSLQRRTDDDDNHSDVSGGRGSQARKSVMTSLAGNGGGNGGGGGKRGPPNNYQYVRKWSVDITALANQLENPKGHTGSYPILRERSVTENLLSPEFNTGGRMGGSRGGGSGLRGSRKKKQLPCPMKIDLDGGGQVVGVSCGAIEEHGDAAEEAGGVGAGGKEEDIGRVDVTNEAGSTPCSERFEKDWSPVPPILAGLKRSVLPPSPLAAVSPTRRVASPSSMIAGDCETPIIVRLDEVESLDNSCRSAEPPSIVVSITTDDDEDAAASPAAYMGDSGGGIDLLLDSSNDENKNSDSGDGRRYHSGASKCGNNACSATTTGPANISCRSAGQADDDAAAARLQLARARRMIMVLLIALLMTLPYSVVVFVDALTINFGDVVSDEITSYGRYYNVWIVVRALTMLQAAVLPLLIVWIDRRLREEILRCLGATRRLRCVCYCNVGAGERRVCCALGRSPDQRDRHGREEGHDSSRESWQIFGRGSSRPTL